MQCILPLILVHVIMKLDHIVPARKSGNENFHTDDTPLDYTLLDFWRWSSSDLLNNTLRGVLAEFLVSKALHSAKGIRTEWHPFDAETPDGIKIEVKSAAYIQSWHQKRYSTIQFGVPHTYGWNYETNSYEPERRRQADVYVFCLFHHKVKETADPLNTAQWRFFVISAEQLNAGIGQQKTIGFKRLLSLAPEEAEYNTLSNSVFRAYVNRDRDTPEESLSQ